MENIKVLEVLSRLREGVDEGKVKTNNDNFDDISAHHIEITHMVAEKIFTQANIILFILDQKQALPENLGSQTGIPLRETTAT